MLHSVVYSVVVVLVYYCNEDHYTTNNERKGERERVTSYNESPHTYLACTLDTHHHNTLICKQ